MAPGPPGNETTATQLLPPGTQIRAKKGSVFAPPLAIGKLTHGPKTGAALRTPKWDHDGATVATFLHSQNGPSPASSPSAGPPWQANGRGSASSVVDIVASIASPQRCRPDATRQRPSGGRSLYLWPRRTTFPTRIAVEAARPARCSAPQSTSPVHAGGPIVNNWEARQCGRPTTSIYIHMEAGLCRRP